jgi:hypothetical protein
VAEFLPDKFRDPLRARYAGRFGNDNLDDAGFAGNGNLIAVADPYISRRRLSRSSNARQSRAIRAASFSGFVSLLTSSAMGRQSSECGAIAGTSISAIRKFKQETRTESEQYRSF